MKKVLLLMFFAVVMSSINSDALTYRGTYAALNGVTDTTTVTLEQRIQMCHIALCDEWLAGTISRTDLTNGTKVDSTQMEELAIRGFNGNMATMIKNMFSRSALLQTNSTSITDAQLRTAWLNRVWTIASRIGKGSL